MSFRNQHHRARNSALSLGVKKGFGAIFNRSNTTFQADQRVLEAHQLAGTSEALEIERNEFLEQLKSFDKKRSQLKASGRQNPSFAKGSAVLQ
jgi:hypothetical protein